jgi:CubicO group peptidase (beta-lactamase class C family)
MSMTGIGRTLALALAFSLSLIAQPARAHSDPVSADFEGIHSFVQSEIDASRIPGAAIAIVESGELVYASGFGTDDGADITAHSAFPIGSLTKSFTALAVMQLVEAGRIDLDAPIQHYISWFRVADASASESMTVRMLLNQTSGLSRETGIKPLVEEWGGTTEEYVRSLRTVELNRPAGETYEYSNANFVTLGLLIETVSGQAYGEYVQQHIFAPLDMHNSYASHEEGRQAGMVALHRYWFGIPVETDTPHLPGQIPAGFIVSTVEDMANYLSMYLNGGTFEGRQILSSEGVALMLQPATNEFSPTLLGTTFDARYGMGWFAGPFGAQQDARWHMGQLPMFNAWMVILPETDQAMVLMVNANSSLPLPGATEVFSRIPVGVASMLAGEEAPGGTSLTRFYVLFNIIVIAVVAVQIAALVRLVLRAAESRIRYRLPLMWELGLSLLILAGLPLLSGIGWGASFAAMPDLTLVVALVATLWLATGVVRIGKLVTPRINRRATKHASRRGDVGAPAT